MYVRHTFATTALQSGGMLLPLVLDLHKNELGLTHDLTMHGLRHTNAALLLYAGEDIENISAHLGHASSEITSRVYAHMYTEVKLRMAKTVSSALLFTK